MKNLQYYLIFLILFFSCQNNTNTAQLNASDLSVNKNVIEFVSPFNGNTFKLGDKINFVVKKTTDSIVIDSIKITIANTRIEVLKSGVNNFSWDSKNSKLGKITVLAEAFMPNAKINSVSMVLQLLSDTRPVEYGYKIIKVYPHSRGSYTQGLIYENGYFFESAGEWNESALRKVKLETGEAILSVNMDPSIFAEGLAQYKGKLYQLTYKDHICFIYDKNTFKALGKFNYDFNEGWGLECDGKNFLMTDGGNNVYFMEPENFTLVGEIEVNDDKGPVDSINELELIDGRLYANVYRQNFVVIINLKNGKIEGKIDFTDILPKSDYDAKTDVLNGIAWNPKNGHLFITGKYWPKLFEVSIFKK